MLGIPRFLTSTVGRSLYQDFLAREIAPRVIPWCDLFLLIPGSLRSGKREQLELGSVELMWYTVITGLILAKGCLMIDIKYEVVKVLTTSQDCFFSDDPVWGWSTNQTFVEFATVVFDSNRPNYAGVLPIPPNMLRYYALVALDSHVQEEMPPEFQEIYDTGLPFFCSWSKEDGPYITGNAGIYKGMPWMVVGYGEPIASALQCIIICFSEHASEFEKLGWVKYLP